MKTFLASVIDTLAFAVFGLLVWGFIKYVFWLASWDMLFVGLVGGFALLGLFSSIIYNTILRSNK